MPVAAERCRSLRPLARVAGERGVFYTTWQAIGGFSASAAIAGLDGTDLDGRAIRVNEAQERAGGSRGGGGGGDSRGGGRW